MIVLYQELFPLFQITQVSHLGLICVHIIIINHKSIQGDNQFHYPRNQLAAATCPMRDTSCMDEEKSNEIYSVTTLDDAECASEYDSQLIFCIGAFPNSEIDMLTLPLLFQICAARYYGVLTGHLHISHLKKMCTTVFSTVLFFHLVVTNMSATPPTPLSSTQAPESACQTHSSAARVGPGVQLLEGSATGGAWLGAGAASSPPAPGPPSGRLQVPYVPSKP